MIKYRRMPGSKINPATMDRPVHALHVFPDLSIGGTQVIFLNTLRALDPAQCLITVACLGGPGPVKPEVVEHAPVHCQTRSDANNLSALSFLVRLIRTEQVDVVHTYYGRTRVYGRLAGILARVPVIVSGEMAQVGPYSWKGWAAERLFDHFTHHFVAVSEDTRTDLIRIRQVPPCRVTVIYPGIDLVRFDTHETQSMIRHGLGVPDHALVIGIVARLVPYKGHADLIAALPRILQTAPATRLVFIGDGPMAPDLRRQVYEVGLAEQIHFLDARRDIPKLLRALDVFVLPSRQEGLGLAIIEAMAAGLPVVATRVGGIPEVVVDGETGLLVEPRNPPELAEAIVHLLTNPDTRRQMGIKGRQRIEAHFTAQRTAANLTTLYCHLLKAKEIG